MKCCGKEVQTPFCPHCGAKQHAVGLASLLGHCKEKLRNVTTQYECEVKRSKRDGVLIPDGVAHRHARIISKWQSWVDALEPLVESQEEEEAELENEIIPHLALSVRASNALEREGITTVDQLCEWTAADLLNLRNFGETCLVEVVNRLVKRGRTLKGQ